MKKETDITGRLEQWYYFNEMIYGNIFNDNKLRWPDGYPIHTSTIIGDKHLKEGDLVITKNSTYLLGKKID